MSFLKHARTAVALVLLATGVARAQEERFDFGMRDAPRSMPDLNFTSVNGTRLSLTDFRGKYVLLNVWATWCPPCREELPSLERLQGALGGAAFQVITLSTDTGRGAAVQRLYQDLDLSESGIFIDETGSAMRDLGIFGMPTTLLIDGDGNEIGRKIGPAVWDNAAALAFFRAKIEGKVSVEPVPIE